LGNELVEKQKSNIKQWLGVVGRPTVAAGLGRHSVRPYVRNAP
jgi:hypothetical protein